ncbi:MAG: hypothetical protein ETSY2_41130 [Candidatus Entotheonella gemina]|uniref:Histidine kinase domain-containing protein n=1 Tax=Candidatus Entotheonella gemina TaxID=1429439 RepID=W4LNQ4_9BACT|nr:MAG: hypothetical protein ETSY2_41130 [Candidatus Entotheonella gemina]
MDSKSGTLSSFYQNLINFVSDHPEPEAIKSYLERMARTSVQADSDYLGPTIRAAGHRVYDAIIENIFKSVISAVSRETLLSETIDALWRHKSSNSSLCLFVLEAPSAREIRDGDKIKAVSQKGLNENLWENFSELIRSRLHESELLQNLLVRGESIPIWLNLYIPYYKGEFDILVKPDLQNKSKSKSYWISAVALKGGQIGRPNQSLIALYVNRGDELAPKLPQGANQEWRVLQFLGVAYQVLQHQLANVAEEVHGQRQKLLSFLAPGIMHHEMGIQVENMCDLLKLSEKIAQRLDEKYREEDTKRLWKNCNVLIDMATGLFNISDAFNNMERRRAREVVYLEDIFKDIETVTSHRLSKVGVQLIWDPALICLNLETDPALLLHMLLNIIINATNAFEDIANNEQQ